MALKVRPLLAAFLPLACLRALAARVLMGAHLGKGVRLALGVYLDASSITLGDGVHVGRFTFIKDVNSLELADGVRIGPHNQFSYLETLSIGRGSKVGGHLAAVGSPWSGEKGGLIIGESVEVTGKHHFDCTRTISVGDETTVAGVFSSIWTHGYRRESLQDVRIGKRCYIGASVKIASGTELPDDTVVAMGSVVRGVFTESNCLIAGVPAKVVRHRYNPKRTGG